jgi:hypothetical protein
METLTSEPEVISGPLRPNPHAVQWPRSGGAGTCSHSAPDSCAYCSGDLADMREADRIRRAAKRAGATR